jgi:hypothetical protein
MLGGTGRGIRHDPSELGDGLTAPVQEGIGRPQREAKRHATRLQIDRLSELLHRRRVLAPGHQGVALGAHLRRGSECAGGGGLKRGRLLARGQEQHRADEEASHDQCSRYAVTRML